MLLKYGDRGEPLLGPKEMARMVACGYEDFPECFYFEDWKVAFINGEVIQDIVKRQLSPKVLEGLSQRRALFSLHMLDI